jgi:lysophospholipid acyltransferase (LPLAT)-like uncharacterized protein
VSRARYPWWMEPAAWLGALLARALGATWRVREQRDPEYDAGRARGERFLYCFWHARLFPLVYLRRNERIAVLVSRHRDGQLITRIIEHLGFTSARGSSTRGGEAGVRELLVAARDGRELAITPDGPRGPAESLKDGLAYVAARSGLRVVTIATSARDAWVFRSWDRFRVPKPFALVHVRYGAPVAVHDAGEEVRADLEQRLRSLTLETAAASGEVA